MNEQITEIQTDVYCYKCRCFEHVGCAVHVYTQSTTRCGTLRYKSLHWFTCCLSHPIPLWWEHIIHHWIINLLWQAYIGDTTVMSTCTYNSSMDYDEHTKRISGLSTTDKIQTWTIGCMATQTVYVDAENELIGKSCHKKSSTMRLCPIVPCCSYRMHNHRTTDTLHPKSRHLRHECYALCTTTRCVNLALIILLFNCTH